jgi:molybdopterin molybdotransferase
MLPVREATGLTLAADAVAATDLPLWDSSAMDGYALRGGEYAAGTGFELVGEVAAGSPEDPAIGSGQAVRIMTGAPLPSDTDAVLPYERAAGDGVPGRWGTHEIALSGPVAEGANVRRRGEDVAAGEVLAEAGSVLTAQLASALAAAGVREVLVRPRPRVAVLATGSELRGPDEELRRGEIRESNSVLMAGLLEESGIQAVAVDVSSDDAEATARRIRTLAEGADVVLSTGGVGPGRHDVVRIALEECPGVRSVRVAVRPGQPQYAGWLTDSPRDVSPGRLPEGTDVRLPEGATDGEGAWIFALPGNPVSAAVSFELFVRPALLAMQGRRSVQRLRLPATARVGWSGRSGRLQVMPVRLETGADGLECRPSVDPRGIAHAVGSHGATDGYAIVEAERGDVVAGERVDVIVVGG